jgi:transposase
MDAMQAAVHLVTVEGMTVTAAAKAAGVPRMTLSDRLRKDAPTEDPKLGRPQELPAAVEEAIVKCLITCAEFQYPMTRRDVQNIVQAYVLEKNVKTRWEDGLPGRDWVDNFRKRWRHKIKLKKPTNIKRSRAAVSPKTIRSFFEHLGPNVEGVPDTHFFNFDETNLRDDPGKLFYMMYKRSSVPYLLSLQLQYMGRYRYHKYHYTKFVTRLLSPSLHHSGYYKHR